MVAALDVHAVCRGLFVEGIGRTAKQKPTVEAFGEVDDLLAPLDAVEETGQLAHAVRPGKDAAPGVALFHPRHHVRHHPQVLRDALFDPDLIRLPDVGSGGTGIAVWVVDHEAQRITARQIQ